MRSRLFALLVVGSLLGFGLFYSSPAADAQATKLTPERHLFGSWHGAGGDWTLRFGSDRSAVMETGLTKNDGKSIDWRRGTIAVKRGAWTLQVKDIDRREYTYGILSLGPDELNLIDNAGAYIRFFRTRDTVQKALVGRWLGPGSDYTLILNTE